MTTSFLEILLKAHTYPSQTSIPLIAKPIAARSENGTLKKRIDIKKITYEITLDDLTPDATEIHTRVYNKTAQAINRPFRRREVYESPELDELGYEGISFLNTPIIVLAKKVARQNPELGYTYILNTNPNQRLSPTKYLEITLSHEYGHQVFREFYKTGIQEVLTKRNTVQQDKILQGIDEAFAFLFGEEISETKVFSKITPTIYSATCDQTLFERAYHQLKAYSDEYGTRHVLDNFSRIIEESLNNIAPTINRSIFSIGLKF